jgi:molecular chaperone DnaJ
VFTRDGHDLRCHATVPMTAAALGTTLRLPLLEADIATADSDVQLWIDLDVKPGTQSGTEQVIRGRGMPSLRTGARGDVIVTIDVETPARLDDRQEELLRELARLRNEEQPEGRIQPSHRSVFGRLKDAFK